MIPDGANAAAIVAACAAAIRRREGEWRGSGRVGGGPADAVVSQHHRARHAPPPVVTPRAGMPGARWRAVGPVLRQRRRVFPAAGTDHGRGRQMADSEVPRWAKATLEDWHRAAARSAPGGAVDDLVWHTPDGIAVKPLYTLADIRESSAGGHTCPGSSRSCGGRRRPCTRCARGRSASTRASRRPRNPTPSTGARSRPVGRACRWLSISPRTAVTTRTIRAWWATSARPASRSTRSRT